MSRLAPDLLAYYDDARKALQQHLGRLVNDTTDTELQEWVGGIEPIVKADAHIKNMARKDLDDYTLNHLVLDSTASKVREALHRGTRLTKTWLRKVGGGPGIDEEEALMLFELPVVSPAPEPEWGLFEIKDPDTGIRKLRPIRLQVAVESARGLEKPAVESQIEAKQLVDGIDITLRKCGPEVLMFSKKGKKFYDRPPTVDPDTGELIDPPPGPDDDGGEE